MKRLWGWIFRTRLCWLVLLTMLLSLTGCGISELFGKREERDPTGPCVDLLHTPLPSPTPSPLPEPLASASPTAESLTPTPLMPDVECGQAGVLIAQGTVCPQAQVLPLPPPNLIPEATPAATSTPILGPTPTPTPLSRCDVLPPTSGAPSCLVTNDWDDGSSGSLRQVLEDFQYGRCVSPLSFASGVSAITLNGTELTVPSSTLTIDGGSGVTVSGNNSSRVFYVCRGADVTFETVTITQGSGAGIYNDGGTVRLASSSQVNRNTGDGIHQEYGSISIYGMVSDNTGDGIYLWGGGAYIYGTVSGNAGTGIFGYGYVSIYGTVSGNTGGGIHLSGFSSNSPSVYISETGIVENNSGASYGGGIYNSGGEVRIYGTVRGNSAAWRGGGIYNFSEESTNPAVLTLGSTARVTSNQVTGYGGQGGGIYNHDEDLGTAPVSGATSSTVFNNTAEICNNFYEDDDGCLLP